MYGSHIISGIPSLVVVDALAGPVLTVVSSPNTHPVSLSLPGVPFCNVFLGFHFGVLFSCGFPSRFLKLND